MNKAQFIELVQASGNYKTKVEAEAAISAFTDAVETVLMKNESISLVGFGAFETVTQKGRSGKIPGTDKDYTTNDKQVPKFRAGKILKSKVMTGSN